MAKYADITPFYEWIEWLEKESNTKCPEYETLMFYEIIDKLDSLPEVVRCKDCKHLEVTGCYGECGKLVRVVKPWDFCSYGERKDNG